MSKEKLTIKIWKSDISIFMKILDVAESLRGDFDLFKFKNIKIISHNSPELRESSIFIYGINKEADNETVDIIYLESLYEDYVEALKAFGESIKDKIDFMLFTGIGEDADTHTNKYSSSDVSVSYANNKGEVFQMDVDIKEKFKKVNREYIAIVGDIEINFTNEMIDNQFVSDLIDQRDDINKKLRIYRAEKKRINKKNIV